MAGAHLFDLVGREQNPILRVFVAFIKKAHVFDWVYGSWMINSHFFPGIFQDSDLIH